MRKLAVLLIVSVLSFHVHAQVKPTDKFVSEGVTPPAKWYLTESYVGGQYSVKVSDGIYRGLLKIVGTGTDKGKETLMFAEVDCRKSLLRFKSTSSGETFEWNKFEKNTIKGDIAKAICE